MLQLQSHKTLIKSFIIGIPRKDVNSRLICGNLFICVACMWHTASVLGTFRYLGPCGNECIEKYYLCIICRRDQIKYIKLGLELGSGLESPAASILQHTADMKRAGHTNLIKIAINRIVSLVPYHVDQYCAYCAVKPADSVGLCSRCYYIMVRKANCIRGVVVTWYAGMCHLLIDCNNVIISKYVELLLIPDSQ